MTQSELLQLWLVRILGHEGSEVNDPEDPGGHTKWGISQRSYPDLDISALEVEDAAAIYMRDFAVPMKLWRFDDGVAYQLFDFAVNSGPTTALKQLQEAIGVKPDGVVGTVTLEAIAEKSESDLVMLVIAERLDYMASLRNWPAHGRGWVRRMATNLRYAAADTE